MDFRKKQSSCHLARSGVAPKYLRYLCIKILSLYIFKISLVHARTHCIVDYTNFRSSLLFFISGGETCLDQVCDGGSFFPLDFRISLLFIYGMHIFLRTGLQQIILSSARLFYNNIFNIKSSYYKKGHL